jgi:uncharacterized protein
MFRTRVRTIVRTVAATVIVWLAGIGVFAQESTPWSQNVSPLPSPTGMVNDYAGIIDEATKQQLESRVRQFKEKTNIEIAVAVVRTTGERPIFDYSLAVARGWGIGSKETDNPSALLFVAVDDRKYFTQVSRELEDELPDGLAGSLQRQYLVPEFRRGNYSKGIADTIDAYIRTIETRTSGGTVASPTPVDRETTGSQGLYSTFCCLVIIGVILVIIFSNRGGRSKGGGGWGGGGFGGASGALPWIIGSAIANASSSSSSDWGGGGDSGGGGDWGGFGGGGDFGGGGAGGDW